MQVEVVTPHGTALTAEVDEVVAPGERGEFGVLPGHTPFMSAMRPGVLRWSKGGSEQRLAVGAGLVEVTGQDRVIVLAERSEKVEDIDVQQARRELEEAEQAQKAGESSAEGKRAWAQARLDAAQKK